MAVIFVIIIAINNYTSTSPLEHRALIGSIKIGILGFKMMSYIQVLYFVF